MNTLRQDYTAPEGVGNAYVGGSAGLPTQAIGTIPQFYMGTEVDGVASRKLGRVVHKNVEMVLILFAGSNNQSVRRKVLDHDRKAYAAAYRAFKEGHDTRGIQGTALTEWPAIDRATAESLRLMNVLSVEQLANLSDTQVMEIGMGGRKWRDKAIDWLQVSSSTADAMALAEQLRDMQAEIARLRAQNSTLEEQVLTSTRMIGMASDIAGGKVNPANLRDSLKYSPDEAPTDTDMDRMLLQANGLDPNNARAAADVQGNSDFEFSSRRTSVDDDDPLGLDVDEVELEDLSRNSTTIEAE